MTQAAAAPRASQPPRLAPALDVVRLTRWREWLALAGLLALVFVAFVFRLNSVVLSDMDEGTYLYAGKLLAEGGLPYRDFLLAHPPLLVLMAAAWERLAGSDVMAARLVYLALVLLSTLPLYGLARELARSHVAGALAVVTYTTGMLLLANMGRTIRLEPIMSGFLIAGSCAYLQRPVSRRLTAGAGALLAAAVLVKLVALVPIGFLLLGDLLFRRRRDLPPSWAWLAAGAGVVLLPAAVFLFSQPHFVEDALLSQLNRPGLPLATRAYFVWQDFTRYPVIPVALVAAVWLLLRSNDRRLRVVALISIGGSLSLVVLFRTFFGYYLVQVLPWLAVTFAAVCAAGARQLGARGRRALLPVVVVLGLALPVAYDEYYYRTAHDHVSSPAEVVARLRGGNGYVYTMYPSLALWSGRTIYPWYYAADALVPRLTGRLGSAEFVRAFSECQALVFYAGELDDYPEAQAYVEREFRPVYQDAFFAVWTRS